jgi:hypothetical protein
LISNAQLTFDNVEFLQSLCLIQVNKISSKFETFSFSADRMIRFSAIFLTSMLTRLISLLFDIYLTLLTEIFLTEAILIDATLIDIILTETFLTAVFLFNTLTKAKFCEFIL